MTSVKWEEGRELSKDMRDTLENVISTQYMKQFTCPNCEEEFASTKESYKDGYCGLCELERRREMKDSHGLEGPDEEEEE